LFWSSFIRVPEIVEKLWEKYGLGENVRKHCIAVAEMALKITESVERRGYRVDKEAVLLGALLHDIGRAITHDPFKHFLKSAEILKAEGRKDRKIAERHFSAGISAEEAKKLGLPEKDYLSESLEEKIVSFTDNMIFGSTVRDFDSFQEA
jgi:uncharacterized protein